MTDLKMLSDERLAELQVELREQIDHRKKRLAKIRDEIVRREVGPSTVLAPGTRVHVRSDVGDLLPGVYEVEWATSADGGTATLRDPDGFLTTASFSALERI